MPVRVVTCFQSVIHRSASRSMKEVSGIAQYYSADCLPEIVEIGARKKRAQ